MTDAIAVVVGGILILALSRRMLLVYAATRCYRIPRESAACPRIWTVCACRNESPRLPSLIASLAGLRYRGEVRIVVIDDGSQDDSAAVLAHAELEHGERLLVRILGAGQRGKADALREGLRDMEFGDSDLLFILDADHRLDENALERLPKYFADPDVAAVAIEHPVSCAERSLVSAYCFLEAAIGELVTSRGQHAIGLPPKLAGSWACRADVFRRLYPSGWQLVDDTVFTAAIVAGGRRILHAADVAAHQDVPDTIRGYVRQHLRWAAGYASSARAAIARRARGHGALAAFDAVATHAGYVERPLLVLLVVVAITAWLVGANAFPASVTLGVAAVYMFVLVIQTLAALRLARASARLRLMSFASLVMLAVDLCVSVAGTVAAIAGRRIAWPSGHR